MDISVTEFKQRCLEIIREVERSGKRVSITRRGRVVAQLRRPGPSTSLPEAPIWERLREAGGRLLASPSESMSTDDDFTALR